MWTPVKLKNGQLNPDHYGLGWFIEDVRGHRLIEHSGSWQGFNTNISRYVDDGLTVVILSNLAGAEPVDLCHHVAGSYMPELAPLAEKASKP